jgi:hypothetical protein
LPEGTLPGSVDFCRDGDGLPGRGTLPEFRQRHAPRFISST